MRVVFGSLSKRMRRRAAYIVITGALGVVASAPMAAIIDSGPISYAVPNSIDGIYLNLVTGVSASTAVPGWDLNVYNNTTGLTFYNSTNAANNAQVVCVGATLNAPALALSIGATIGPASLYCPAGFAAGTNFQVTATQYLGLRFTNETTGTINYGYAQIQSTAGSGSNLGFPATVLRYV